jgi:hypothetical protein
MHKKNLCRKEMKFTTTSLIRDEKSIIEWCSSIMGEGTGSHEDQSHKKGNIHRYFLEVVNVDQLQSYEFKTIQGTHGFHSVRTSDNEIVEMWMRKISFLCVPCSSNEWDDCELTYWVYGWDSVSIPIGQCITMELSQLEEDQSIISTYYDHVLDLVL